MALLLLLLLLPAPAMACPTCGTSAMPGLGSATELIGAYPPRIGRTDAERFPLEGAADRARRLAGAGRVEARVVTVLADRPPLEPSTILAGFSLHTGSVGLHVCGPELTLEVRY